jgi:SAM-dependent methyltransferase
VNDSDKRRGVHLLPRSSLVRTSQVDHPDWNYRPVLGSVQRLRFRFALRLLGDVRFGRLLEVGYGSGVFMPELFRRCDELYGIDPHTHREEVSVNLATHSVSANLTTGNVESLPFRSDFFDAAVSISTLEYSRDIDAACREIRRVLAPGGSLVVVTPGATPLWDLALRVTTGDSPTQYADRRQKLQPALHRHFRCDRQIQLPPFGGRALRLYTGLLLRAD